MMVEPSLILFYIASAIIVGGALGVVMTRNIVYASFALLASLMGVSGIFLLVFAEFLALVQILIYGGAVVIVLLFALMLTRLDDFQNLTDHKQWPIAALISVGFFGLMTAAIVTTAVRTTERQSVDFETLGEALFTQWAIPFEVVSLVLLVALIGAIVLVRTDGDRD